MTIGAVEIMHNEASGLPSLGLDRATQDALATYARMRWPVGTAKAVAREWDLTLDQGKGLVAGRSPGWVIDRVWKHPRGGWAVLLPVLGAVIGTSLDQHIEGERRGLVERAERLGTVVRALRARPGPDDLHSPERDPVGPERREPRRGGMGG